MPLSQPGFYLHKTGGSYFLHYFVPLQPGTAASLSQSGTDYSLQIFSEPSSNAPNGTGSIAVPNFDSEGNIEIGFSNSVDGSDTMPNFSLNQSDAEDKAPGELDLPYIYWTQGERCRFVIRSESDSFTHTEGTYDERKSLEEVTIEFPEEETAEQDFSFVYDYNFPGATNIGGKGKKGPKRKLKIRKK